VAIVRARGALGQQSYGDPLRDDAKQWPSLKLRAADASLQQMHEIQELFLRIGQVPDLMRESYVSYSARRGGVLGVPAGSATFKDYDVPLGWLADAIRNLCNVSAN
jgi:hypothetical protein